MSVGDILLTGATSSFVSMISSTASDTLSRIFLAIFLAL